MRTMLLAVAAATSLSLAAVAADARPLVVVEPLAAAPVVLVSGGCGFGFHRGPYGGCIRDAVVVVAPRVIPFYPCRPHWTAFGRRVCG